MWVAGIPINDVNYEILLAASIFYRALRALESNN